MNQLGPRKFIEQIALDESPILNTLRSQFSEYNIDASIGPVGMFLDDAKFNPLRLAQELDKYSSTWGSEELLLKVRDIIKEDTIPNISSEEVFAGLSLSQYTPENYPDVFNEFKGEWPRISQEVGRFRDKADLAQDTYGGEVYGPGYDSEIHSSQLTSAMEA